MLRGYAREGIGHVQLVLDPITDALDRGPRARSWTSWTAAEPRRPAAGYVGQSRRPDSRPVAC